MCVRAREREKEIVCEWWGKQSGAGARVLTLAFGPVCRKPQHAGAPLAGHRPHQQDGQTNTLQLPGEGHQDPQLSGPCVCASCQCSAIPVDGHHQPLCLAALSYLTTYYTSLRLSVPEARVFWQSPLLFATLLDCPRGSEVSSAGQHTSHQYAKTICTQHVIFV